jgi:hypothetical protein
MKGPGAEFEAELELFRKEVQGATQFFYGYLAVNSAAAGRRAVLNLMNEAPLFWNTTVSALQLAGFVALHRVFDDHSPHSVHTLLRIAQRNPSIFSKQALGERKRRGSTSEPEWLADYLAKSYVPAATDFRKLRKLVLAKRRIYDANYSAIRHKYFAHREVADNRADVAALFSRTNVRELQRIYGFLNQLHDALWQLTFNGRPPTLRPVRHSVANIRKRRRPGWRQRGVHEAIIHEVDDFFHAAVPNPRRRRKADG